MIPCYFDKANPADVPLGMLHSPECGYYLLEKGPKMNIAFDLDGVLYPWHTAIHNHLLRSKEGFSTSYRELWSDPYRFFSEVEWKYLASIPTVYSTIFPDKNILKVLNEISDSGNTIYYLSNREQELDRVTQSYLEDHKFPQSTNLILTKSKDSLIRTLGIDVFVEDKPENLEKTAHLCKVIGIAHPWNEIKREYLESLGVIFIPSVTKILEVV